MPSASAIKAGETFVRMSLEAGEMEKSLAQIRNKLDKFARSAVKVGATLAAIGGAGVVALSKAAAAANRVELVGRRLDAVFRDASDEARKFARELAVSIGDSRFAVEDTLVTFKSFFAEIVNSEQDQIAFSQRMTQLSRDFAAFQGMDSTEALQRFISALSGSPEVLDRFGINLKAAALDAEFAAKGLDITTESAAEFQKVIARMDIIERTMSKQGAIGKAVTELATFSGALRAATSAVRDFTVAVGQALLPILRPVIATFANMARGFETIATHAPALTVAFGVIAVGTLAAGVALVSAAAAATALGLAIAVVSATATAYSGWAKMVKMETASVSAQLAFAKSQLQGLGIMAAQTGLRWAGFDASLKKSVATLGLVRAGLIGVVSVMGKLTLFTVALSTVLGSVPAISGSTAVAVAALAVAIIFLRKQFRLLGERTKFANKWLAAYQMTTTKSMTGTGRIVTRSGLSQMDKMAIKTALLGKRFRILGFAARWAAKGMAAFAAASTAMLAGLALVVAGVAMLAVIIYKIADELNFFSKVSERVSSSWKKAMDTMGDTKPLQIFLQEYGRSMSGLIDATKATVSKLGGLWKDAKDGWAILWGNPTELERKQKEVRTQAKADAEKSKEDLLSVQRELQDARIEGITNSAQRERVALRTKQKREIQDEIANNKEIQNLRDMHKQQLKDLDADQGPQGRQARMELKARQQEELQNAIRNSEKINTMKATHAQQRHNQEMQLARELHEARVRNASEIAQLRIQASKEGAAQEIALIEHRRKVEEAAARARGATAGEIADINATAAAERSLVEAQAYRTAIEARKSLEQQLIDARIQGIEDANKREEAGLFEQAKRRADDLREQRDNALAAVEGNAKKEASVREFYAKEFATNEALYETQLQQLRMSNAKERADEEAKAAEERAAELQSLQDDIDKLRIDFEVPEGLQRTLAQLELQRKNALRDAAGDEKQIEKINELFNLRGKIARQGKEAAQSRVAGATDIRQILAFRGGQAQPKAEQLQEEGNRLLKKSVDTLNELLLIFGVTA